MGRSGLAGASLEWLSGRPLDGAATALLVSGTDLLVGGYFHDAAGIAAADHVARFALVRPCRPDRRIRIGDGAYIGNDVYNTTGADQSRTGSTQPGASVIFGISIENDGRSDDRFKVRATGAAVTGYPVKYLRGTTNSTAEVVAGTFTTWALAPGGTYLITATPPPPRSSG